MGTRSGIGIKLDDGSIQAVYCHWNGHPRYNGQILQDHYTDRDKIMQLISLGDLSSLGAEIGTKHDFDDRPENECTFYGRDRGEKRRVDRYFDGADDYADNFQSDVEYLYLFTDGGWIIHIPGITGWHRLDEVLEDRIVLGEPA